MTDDELISADEIALRNHDTLVVKIEDTRRRLLTAWKDGAAVGVLKDLEAKLAELLRAESSARGGLTRRSLEPRSTCER